MWSVARLVMDSPVDLNGATPVLNGSAGVDHGKRGGKAAPEVPVVLSAAGGGAQVIVRDGSGEVMFKGVLSFGETRTLQACPRVDQVVGRFADRQHRRRGPRRAGCYGARCLGHVHRHPLTRPES